MLDSVCIESFELSMLEYGHSHKGTVSTAGVYINRVNTWRKT